MNAPPSPTLSDSALLDSLEDDNTFDHAAHRERRMEELQAEVRKVQELRTSEYGRVLSMKDEKALIERMSKEKYCLLNFIHPDFHRCKIMDNRLEEIAPRHKHTLFLRTTVAEAPFLVAKFGIQVLPCVLIFVDGRCVDRLIGFEELGHNDQFSAKALEFRLQQSGALPSGPLTLGDHVSSALLADRDSDDDHDHSSDDERDQGGRRRGPARRGKTGIRDGFASRGMGEDE